MLQPLQPLQLLQEELKLQILFHQYLEVFQELELVELVAQAGQVSQVELDSQVESAFPVELEFPVALVFQAEQVVANIAIELYAVDLWQLRIVIALLNPVRGGALRVAVDQ